MTTKPTPGALRAVMKLNEQGIITDRQYNLHREFFAHIIDRETGLPALVVALEVALVYAKDGHSAKSRIDMFRAALAATWKEPKP